MMKKFAALLLALLMIGTLATAQSFDFTGTWYLVSISAEGVTLNPADMGMEMSMTLNADGTGAVSTTGEEDKVASWALDGETLTVTADEEPLAFTVSEEGQLVAEAEGAVMTFGREPAAPGFVAAAEIPAEDIAAFDGTWTITTVNAYGMVVPFAAMAQSGLENATVVIENGAVTSFDATEPAVGTLVDGKLVIASELGEEFAQTVSLLEDGTIALNYMGILFYCEMAEVVE
ncbi:MAG TPA: hypothetical protein PKU80_06695 [Candidatus Limiplasma sp.]|nr:hypothetical protein [Candidatus Limiplasma sp.]HRX08081.1 hypothetical protein [Candidatus Limiplasma sp.]